MWVKVVKKTKYNAEKYPHRVEQVHRVPTMGIKKFPYQLLN